MHLWLVLLIGNILLVIAAIVGIIARNNLKARSDSEDVGVDIGDEASS